MDIKKQAMSLLVTEAVKYLEHEPEKHFDRLISIAKVLVKGRDPFYQNIIKQFDDMWHDESSPWRGYLINYLTKLNPNQRKKFATNFLVNASIIGFTEQQKMAEKLDCNIPWTILMDPTSACNLKCTGCWAAEYAKQNNLTFEELDNVIEQGKKLSIYFYVFSGGEPLVRKKDILRLCEKHSDCFFAAFTNGTLIDEEFASEMERLGNFVPIISIEGFEEATDMRRGKGVYQSVIRAMDILHARNLAFGMSVCYHSKNTDYVGSDEFVDFMIEKGVLFGWYFTYMPVGADAHKELLATPEQRAHMYKRVNEIRATKPIFVLDFWNDGAYVDGCIAAGRRYFHINSAGDAEPCAFIHYSNYNIREKSVMEILKSPLFMAYHKGQPFNKNMLRPCPLLDNPEALAGMVKATGAHSTEALSPEDVDVLTSKTKEQAELWAETADDLWKVDPKNKENVRDRVNA
ncbi:radical SAM protein [Ethanoligenens harbinense]|uniref:Radical SAM domain protein n=1 Tax=Ethanoligenens harbinense (strain DSM 18485 / JCM 12961 / CGMCC 1.5033 / YUAN-3) TaxID=663278 RepID=E6U8K7_ETHHY|nr:radical SAM protein [Ethanoligenens harbinense]ADU25998.1 Radical SAM domain protein [Ethanoligenens harbinense YUAN-3]